MLCSKGRPIGCTSLKPFRPDRESKSIDLGGLGLGGGIVGPSEFVGLGNGGYLISASFFLFWPLVLPILGAIALCYVAGSGRESDKG